MELRQLRYFVAVVEANGLRKAARDLYIAPSALSRSLQQLEREHGVALLRRSACGVEPTTAGRDLLDHARLILERADAATTAMRSHARSPHRLRVGAVGGLHAASELTAPILSTFRLAHPSMQVVPQQIRWDDQISALIDGELDVALVRNPIDHPGVDLVPLAHEPRVLLVGANHDLAAESEVDVDDILNEHTVGLAAPEEWSRFWQLDDVRGRSNVLSTIAPANSIREMQNAAASGNAIISTSGSVGRFAPTPETRCINLYGVEPSTISVARRHGDRRQTVEMFIELAGRTVEEHIALLPGGLTA
jgi:DNA-binding transcriptional LysR family regulator